MVKMGVSSGAKIPSKLGYFAFVQPHPEMMMPRKPPIRLRAAAIPPSLSGLLFFIVYIMYSKFAIEVSFPDIQRLAFSPLLNTHLLY
jgi:hypothetical protein